MRSLTLALGHYSGMRALSRFLVTPVTASAGEPSQDALEED